MAVPVHFGDREAHLHSALKLFFGTHWGAINIPFNIPRRSVIFRSPLATLGNWYWHEIVCNLSKFDSDMGVLLYVPGDRSLHVWLTAAFPWIILSNNFVQMFGDDILKFPKIKLIFWAYREHLSISWMATEVLFAFASSNWRLKVNQLKIINTSWLQHGNFCALQG